MATSKPPSWLIIGNYGTNNTGDDAMLLSLIMALRQAQPAASISVLTKSNAVMAYLRPYAVTLVPTSIKAMLRGLWNADALVLGGGTHFHDDYVFWRYLRHMRYMALFLALFALTRALGKRVYLLSMGFGPFQRWPTRLIMRSVAALSTAMTARDTASYQRLRELIGPDSRLTAAFDIAVQLEPRPLPRLPGTLTLGVSIIAIDHIPPYTRADDQALQQQTALALEQALRTHPTLKIAIFVFRGPWPRESDVAVSERLYMHLRTIAPERVTLWPYEPDPRIFLNAMAACDRLFTTRFHATLFAYSAQAPMLGLIYHAKNQDLAEMIGVPAKATVSLAEALQGDLPERIAALITQPEAFQAHLPLEQAQALAAHNSTAFRLPPVALQSPSGGR